MSEVGHRFCIPNKIIDDADAASPEATSGEPSIDREQLKAVSNLVC